MNTRNDARRASIDQQALAIVAELRSCALDALQRLAPLIHAAEPLELPLSDAGLRAALLDASGYDALSAALAARAADGHAAVAHSRLALTPTLVLARRRLAQSRLVDALPLLRGAVRVLARDAWPRLYAVLLCVCRSCFHF
jgi:hypothetical protein